MLRSPELSTFEITSWYVTCTWHNLWFLPRALNAKQRKTFPTECGRFRIHWVYEKFPFSSLLTTFALFNFYFNSISLARSGKSFSTRACRVQFRSESFPALLCELFSSLHNCNHDVDDDLLHSLFWWYRPVLFFMRLLLLFHPLSGAACNKTFPRSLHSLSRTIKLFCAPLVRSFPMCDGISTRNYNSRFPPPRMFNYTVSSATLAKVASWLWKVTISWLD